MRSKIKSNKIKNKELKTTNPKKIINLSAKVAEIAMY